MTQSKKYTYRVEQDGANWTVDIIRRVTSRTAVVSKTQAGFATEAEAKNWGESEVKAFLIKTNLGEQEKRRGKKIEDEKKISMKVKKVEVQEGEQEEKDSD
jgi:hypothetical protein